MLRPRSGTAPLTSQKTPETRSPFWWLRWVPAVVLIVVLLDLIYILGSVALVPVLASFAVAYLLNPLVFVGEKRGLSRPLSTGSTHRTRESSDQLPKRQFTEESAATNCLGHVFDAGGRL